MVDFGKSTKNGQEGDQVGMKSDRRVRVGVSEVHLTTSNGIRECLNNVEGGD